MLHPGHRLLLRPAFGNPQFLGIFYSLAPGAKKGGSAQNSAPPPSSSPLVLPPSLLPPASTPVPTRDPLGDFSQPRPRAIACLLHRILILAVFIWPVLHLSREASTRVPGGGATQSAYVRSSGTGAVTQLRPSAVSLHQQRRNLSASRPDSTASESSHTGHRQKVSSPTSPPASLTSKGYFPFFS